MLPRRAFTLVEVLVALTVAAIVVLAARSTLVAGLDTSERAEQHEAVAQDEARFRELVSRALRHATDAPVPEAAPVSVRATLAADGRTSHVLEFYSRGFAHPAGSGAAWHVTVAPGELGLSIEGRSPDGALQVTGSARALNGMLVQARAPDGSWPQPWPDSRQLPTAIVLDFQANDGATRAPLIVNTRLESVP